jgi:hypothetical protein
VRDHLSGHRSPTRRCRQVAAGIVALPALLAASTAAAQPIPEPFRDPADGRLDLSDWLLNRKGFLPMPIVVTEPALGYGGGLALTFFDGTLAEGVTKSGRLVPPTIFGGAGFYTSDGSYGGGLFAFHPFRGDRFRYLGALGGASLELEFFGFDPEGPLAGDPLPYVIAPLFTVQRLQARLARTDLFVGTHYEYLRTKSTFAAAPPVEVPQRDLDVNVGGLGASLELDTRDNLLDARRGADVVAKATWYAPAFGGDEAFQKYQLKGLLYAQPSTRWGFGVRVDGRFASGDTPFFYKPYLAMRGLPAMQYANDVAVLGETEARFSIDARWTVLGFGGVGRVAASFGDLGGVPSVGAGGVGVRYLVARQLGLGTGIDVALGRGGELAVYFQTGSAWR